MSVFALRFDPVEAGNIELIGNKVIARSMHSWLGLSPFAKVERQVAS